MEMSGLSFELARATGYETRHDTWLDYSGGWGRSVSEICSLLDATNLDSSQLLRLNADPPRALDWRKILKYHCQVANQSQSFYRSVSREQWLRTFIESPKPVEIFDSEEDESDASLTIHSNVVPRQAYLRAYDLTTLCLKSQHCRGFVPANSTVDGLDIPSPHSCRNCALADRLSRNYSDCMAADELDTLLTRFWFLEEKEVKDVMDLGGGSEGEVSKVRWRKGVFARKRFDCTGLGEQELQNGNMNRELGVALRVSHPNIVHCFGCSRWADSPDYCDLFMELLDVDLGRFLFEKRETDSEFPFSFRDSLDVLLQVAQAMEHLHDKGFVHGDLQPQNIFMSCFELAHSGVQYYLVKVGDFGCTQSVDSSSAFDFRIGTTSYLAPEVLRCRSRKHRGALPEYPQKIDVYSFGVVAYQVLTGVTEVYEGLSNLEMIEGVIESRLTPDQLASDQIFDGDRSSLLSLIRSCWTSNPEDRPSFSQLCADLDERLVEHDHKFLQRENAKRKHHSIGDSIDDCNQWSNKDRKRTIHLEPPSTPSSNQALRNASYQGAP